MELFEMPFGELLLFVYHCFDRIVINRYLSGLSRPSCPASRNISLTTATFSVPQRCDRDL